MKILLILIGLFTTMLFACQNNSNTVHEGEVEKQDSIIQHKEEHAELSNPVSLNNGEKWTANTATTEGIKKMTELINELSGQPKLEDYHALQVKLSTEFNQILQKCTMTGEAHNQLHNYLLPMKEMFDNLNSQDIEVCSHTLNKITQHLNEYENYFL